MWTFRAIVISALAMGLASDSWAYLFRGLPACPWYSPRYLDRISCREIWHQAISEVFNKV